MCDPVTALVVASTVVSTASAYQQGQYQEDIAEYNARVSENEATRVRNIGVDEENKQRRQTAELISRQRTQLAASGVDIGTGSALQLQEDAALLGEIDALNIRENFAEQATALERGTVSGRSQGRAAARAGTTQAFGTLLSGGAKVAGKWYTPNSSVPDSATVNTGNQFAGFV